jgi:dTMP kinase
MFIVLDGIDGAGKKTQTDLLNIKLTKDTHQVEVVDFPRYGEPSAGPVEEYLNGRYGSAREVGPYRASIFYAVDRYAASPQIKQWLKEKKIVLANRYVSSNLCHQGAKISDAKKRQEFFAWDENLEYNIFAIPRPDLTIILYLEPKLAQALIDKKAERAYLQGQKRDIHEADLAHLQAAADCYLALAKNFPNYTAINCAPEGLLLTPSQIHEQIWQTLSPLFPNS